MPISAGGAVCHPLFRAEAAGGVQPKSIRRVLTASWGGGEDVFGFFLAVSALLEEHSRGDARNLPF